MNIEERLRTERIGKLLLTFSVPSIISLVITAVYNMVATWEMEQQMSFTL